MSTISRALGSADEVSVEKVRGESRNLVIEHLSAEGLSCVTLDFDGSVLSTGRHAEGTAVGFNKPVIKPAKATGIKGTSGLTVTPKGPKGQLVTPPKPQTTTQPSEPKKPDDEEKQNQSTTPKFELEPGTKSIPGAK